MKNFFGLERDHYEAVCNTFDQTLENVDEKVEILKKWIQTQPHLPEMMPSPLIRNFLNLNKGSIENTKPCIDQYYTIRHTLPEIYQKTDPDDQCVKDTFKYLYYVPLPKNTKELYRVIVLKIRDLEMAEKADPYNYVAKMMNITEVRLFEDFNLGDIHIIDLANTSLRVVLNFTPAVIAKIYLIYEKVYRLRVKGFIFVNSPPFVGILLNIFKSIMSPKVFGRVQHHRDTSILKDIFPPEMLPRDYGGTERSLEELQSVWIEKSEEYRDRFKALLAMEVAENLRPQKLENDDDLGFHGTFKTLNFD